MKNIVLGNAKHRTSILGLGTSALIGGNSREESLRLLETAYEEGIRHFDTAPLYGSGDAEIVLGEFRRKYRDSITITTKFGLIPMASSPSAQSLKSILRKFMRFSPKFMQWLRSNSGKAVAKGTYTTEKLQASLDTSLSKLCTDYIDCFLLHDCAVGDCTPEVLEFLESAVKLGKIRSFGVGTSVTVTQELWKTLPALLQITQFDNNLFNRHIQTMRSLSENLPPPMTSTMITHSPFANCLNKLREHWAKYPGQQRDWQASLELDLNDPKMLSALLMNYAVQSNPNGVVLFSSNNLNNLRHNVRTVVEPPFTPTQLQNFVALASTV
jgi:D-threo-aldose 1-dehydrogenase